MTGDEAERVRIWIDYLFIAGMWASIVPGILLDSSGLVTVAAALGIAWLVFEGSMRAIAYWWFG